MFQTDDYINNSGLSLDEEDNKTIFSTDLDSEEREAVRTGEKRGKKESKLENPKRYGLARQRALGMRKYEIEYERIFGKGRQCCKGKG